RHTRSYGDWSSDVCSSDLTTGMFTNSLGPDLESFFWRQVVSKSPARKTFTPEYEHGWDAINELIREGYHYNGHEPNVVYARRERSEERRVGKEWRVKVVRW